MMVKFYFVSETSNYTYIIYYYTVICIKCHHRKKSKSSLVCSNYAFIFNRRYKNSHPVLLFFVNTIIIIIIYNLAIWQRRISHCRIIHTAYLLPIEYNKFYTLRIYEYNCILCDVKMGNVQVANTNTKKNMPDINSTVGR